MTIKPRLGFDDSLDVFGIHGIAALAVSAVVAQCAPAQAESVVKLPAAVTDPAVKAKRATAVLAGGCFWGVEGVFSNVKRSEEHTSELQSLMRISYAVFCLEKKIQR